MTATCLVGLGSNLGDRRALLDEAVRRIQETPHVELVARSRWCGSAAVGGPQGQPDFLNGALRVHTSLSPQSLLAALANIENDLGRTRDSRWAARTIDLDLLLYDDVVLDSPQLILPHPRMAFRRFVLEPACEVAAELVHPTTGWTLSRLLKHVREAALYVAVTGPIGVGKGPLAVGLSQQYQARWIRDPIDSDELAGFYADPRRFAWQFENALVERRRRLLSTQPGHDSRRLSVSDFWLNQSLAYAGVWLESDAFRRFEDVWRNSLAASVRPKLIILLDGPLDLLALRIRRSNRPHAHVITLDHLQQLKERLARCTEARDVGLVLRLDLGADLDPIEESRAAIDGMQ